MGTVMEQTVEKTTTITAIMTGSTKYHKLDRSLQDAARQLENTQRRYTLTSALNTRPDMQALLDAGYIPEYGDKMADSLQPAAQAGRKITISSKCRIFQKTRCIGRF